VKNLPPRRENGAGGKKDGLKYDEKKKYSGYHDVYQNLAACPGEGPGRQQVFPKEAKKKNEIRTCRFIPGRKSASIGEGKRLTNQRFHRSPREFRKPKKVAK